MKLLQTSFSGHHSLPFPLARAIVGVFLMQLIPGIQFTSQSWQEAEGELYLILWGSGRRDQEKDESESYEQEWWCCLVTQSKSRKPFYSLSLKLSTESEVNPWPPTKVQGVLCKFQAPLLSVERWFKETQMFPSLWELDGWAAVKNSSITADSPLGQRGKLGDFLWVFPLLWFQG